MGDGLAELGGEFLAEGVVEWFGNGWVGGVEEGGAVAFFGGGVECELADDEDFSCGIEYAEVHFILIIRKDAEAGDFSAEPLDIRDVVSGFDSEKD